MTKQELEEYQKQVQIKDWMKLINIILNREPTTFDKREHESWMMNKEYRKLFEEQQNKKNGQIKPVVPKDAKEKFNPVQQPSGQYEDKIYYEEQNQQQQNIQQQIPQQIQQIPQQYQQPQPIQYQMQQPPMYPYYNPTNQHLLQTIQDLQMELQLTKTQCDRYQSDIIRAERENSTLRQQVQSLRIENDQIQFKYQQVLGVVNELKQQMLQLQQTIGQQQQQKQEQQQQQQKQNKNKTSTDDYITPIQQETYTHQKQQTTTQQPTQIDVNDVDQIMKNAEQLLGKFQDDDDEILEKSYKNLLQSRHNFKRQVQSESAVLRQHQTQRQEQTTNNIIQQQIQASSPQSQKMQYQQLPQQETNQEQEQENINGSLLPSSKYDRKRK